MQLKKLAITLVVVAVVFAALSGFLGYDLGYKGGRLQVMQDVATLSHEVGLEYYHAGYAQGQRDAYVLMPCCDVCITYPTEEKVLDFLARDNTNSIPYDPEKFICTDFTERVNYRAWDAGIPCYTVWITFSNFFMGTSIVAFPYCDNSTISLMYVSPQTDFVYDPESISEGKSFSVCDPSGDFCNLYTIGEIRIYK